MYFTELQITENVTLMFQVLLWTSKALLHYTTVITKAPYISMVHLHRTYSMSLTITPDKRETITIFSLQMEGLLALLISSLHSIVTASD